VPRWLSRLLRRVHGLADRGEFRLTDKAQQELAALEAGLDPADARDVIATLRQEDFVGRLMSDLTDEWMYVFKPSVDGRVLYLKLVLRPECLVISFHEDSGETDEGP
jgi:hypothetical protein